jgi:transposase
MENRRKFSKDTKLSILRELENGKTAAEVCRENAIHQSLLCKWRKEYRDNPVKAFSGHGNTYKLEARIAEYERLIGQLYAENAVLKKAISALEAYRTEQRRLAGGG